MTTTLSDKAKNGTIFFLVLAFMLVLSPLSTQAQCGPGTFTGFGGPTTITLDPFGVSYTGLSGTEWNPFTNDAQNNSLDLLAPENVLTLLLNFFTQPIAFAQCGNGPSNNDPEVSITATPSSIDSGESSTLEWGSENTDYCVGDGFSTQGNTSGDVDVSPSETTNYAVACYQGSNAGTWSYDGVYVVNYQCGAINSASEEAMAAPFCSNNQTPSGSCEAGETCKTSTNGMYPAPNSCTDYSMYDELNLYTCNSASEGGVTDEATVTVGACSPAYNSSEWYTGGTQVGFASEGQYYALDCAMITPESELEYSYWNRQVTSQVDGIPVFDPVTTTCTYYTGVTGTESMPPETQGDYESFYDSGSSCMTAPVTQCSDGLDNEPDGTIDMDDAGCDGPLDDDESDEAPECSDGEDNDDDGLVDANDGGCSGGDSDDSEEGGITATLTADDYTILVDTPATLNWECTDSDTATISTIGAVTPVSSGSIDTTNITAAEASYQLTCATATDSEVDIVTISTTNPTVSLTAAETRVTDGGSTTLSWDGDQVTSCALTGTNNLSYTGGMDATDVPSGKISTQTTFTVSCDGGVATDTVIVNTVVYIDEF